jgi:hypothetical protein
MSRLARALLPVLFSLSAVLLGSCGSGGDDAPPPPPPVVCAPIPDSAGNSIPCEDQFWASLPGGGAGGADGDAAGADGTAGDGKAISGATVTLVDATGQTRSAVTDAQGYYRINITRLTPPFVLKLVTAEGEERHHSFSNQPVKKRGFITINITGLTDKLASDLARLAGLTGAKDLTPAIVAAQAAAIQGLINNLVNAIRDQIIAAGLNPDTFNPITLFFRPNLQGYDLVLETVAVYIDNSGATQLRPKPQNGCTAPRRWAVAGNICTTSNSPGFVAHGSTTAFSDASAPLVGAVEFSCSNGTLLATSTAPTCAPPANQPCSAPAAAWTVGTSSCSADSAPGSVLSGQSLTLTDSQSPLTGSITYACNNGTLSQTGTPSCANANAGACAAPSANWAVGSNACTSDAAPAGLGNGQSVTLRDATGAATGSITYACSNGTLSQTGTANCGLVAQSCSAPNAVWNVGNAECTSDIAPTPLTTGQSVTLTDTKDPGLGSISYACSNGTLTRTGTATCQSSAGGSGCDAPSSQWSVAGLSCQTSATPTAMSSDEQQTLTDSSAPTLGSIAYRCSNGSLGIVGSPSCTVTAGGCAPPSANWSSGENACTADSAPTALSNNQTITLNDTGSPTNGSVSWSCSNGTLSMAGSPSCFVSQSSGCAAPSRSWVVGNNSCTADTAPSPVANGATATLSDSTSPLAGDATYSCSNGTLSLISASCSSGGTSSSCNTASLTSSGWSVSGNNCTADQAPASITQGTTLSVSDTIGSTVGGITVQCSAGSLQTVGQATCGPSTSGSSCETIVSSWSSGSNTCTPSNAGQLVTIQSGASVTWTDSTSPTTGSQTQRCNNGSLSVVSSSCNLTTTPPPGPASSPSGPSARPNPGLSAAPAQPRRTQ